MMNPFALELSTTTIPQQIDMLKERLPYIVEVYETNKDNSVKQHL